MSIPAFNYCLDHGVLPPEEILVGGITGGIAMCAHCMAELTSLEKVEGEATVQAAIDQIYGEPGA